MAPQTIEAAPTRQSWDRRPEESKRAFDAFCIFRDSADRKLKTVAQELKPSCSVANVGRWSIRHNWAQRSADYDCYVDEQDRAEIARQRVSGRKRRLAIAHALEGLSAHAIKEWQARLAGGRPLNLSLETAALLSKTAAQLEDQALGPEHEESRRTVINVMFAQYESEADYEDQLRAGSSRPAESDDDGHAQRPMARTPVMVPIEELERREWEKMSPEERKAEAQWRTPPKLMRGS